MASKTYPLTIRDKENRFSLFPLDPRCKKIWDFYQEALESTWMVSEVNMADDIMQWKNDLNDNQRRFLKYVLSFFAGSDKIVAENVACNFSEEVEVMEVQFFYRHHTT